MMHLGNLAVPAQATFGRDGAMFESLLGFVAQLSLVLWIVVTFTVVVRFVGTRFYRRAARRALNKVAASASPALDAANSFVAAADKGSTAAPVAPSSEPVPPASIRTPETAGSAMFREARPADFSAAVAGTIESGPSPVRGRRTAAAHMHLLASSSPKR